MRSPNCVCTRCGVSKTLNEFPLRRDRASGRHSWCKPCKAADGRTRYTQFGPARSPVEPKQKVEVETEAPKFVRPIAGKRLLITSAQNCTPVDEPFLQTLKIAAKHLDAELVIIPLRYKNPTQPSKWERWVCAAEDCGAEWAGGEACARCGRDARKLKEDWWDEAVTPYLFNGRKKLCDNLVLVGNVKIQPTATTPLSGFESLTGAESCIIGHPKMQFRAIPVPTGRTAKILTTTGSCTARNYSDTRAGRTGEFHHFLGALDIEVDGSRFHLRQINADRADGSFTNLDKHYTAKGVKKAPPALGLVMGDTHARFIDPKVEHATFGKGGIVETLDPKVLVFHDVIDSYATNPHHVGNPFIARAKFLAGFSAVKAEVEHAAKFVRVRVGKRQGIVVASNHDNFFERWVIRHDWRVDPANAAFYLETASAMLASVRMTPRGTEYADPFRYWMGKLGGPNVRCLGDNESFKLADIECGMHGDHGPNGARGTLKNLSRLGSKVISGHTHTPGIEEGHYQCGTSTPLRLEYTKGPSSWLNAHCVVYASGKRSLITIVDGTWRRAKR